MYLSETDTISISNINPQNKRHLIIVDVCRNLVRIEKQIASLSTEAIFENDSINLINYREIFDNAILLTSEGRIVAYSCDINQSAGDDGSGGVFTQELFDSPNHFNVHVNNDYAILKIDKAFEYAKTMTYKKNAPQTAIFNAGRRRDFFPFAII